MALPSMIRPGVPDDVLDLWSLSRGEAEDVYTEAFERRDDATLRWLARNDRYFLLTCLLERPDLRHDWLFQRCRDVEADPDDYIDLWAREHYKSTIITFAGIIQEILRDPEITVGIFSHDRPSAKDFLKQIKQELEGNSWLIRLFPDVLWSNPKRQAPSWSEDGGITVRRKSNPKESTLEAWGLIEGMPTGKHFRLRVYDDLITEKHVTTPEMVKKATSQWELSESLGVRTAKGGRCWHIGTRYSFGDTYGIILGRKVLRERRHAATADGSFDGKPVFLTQAEWDRKKQNLSKSIIASQQLLNPLAGSETKFNIRLLQFWSVRPKRVNVYIICDPSKGKGASSDRTAFAIIAVDINRNKYLVDGWCHRMSLTRRWQTLRDLWKRWTQMPGVQSVYAGYEQFGMQTDIEYFDERMEVEHLSFPIQELKWPRQGPKSKNDRIERLEPDIRMGRFRLPKVIEIGEEGEITPYDASQTKAAQEAIANGERWRVALPIHKKDEADRIYDWTALFLEEFTFFPFAPYDDILDACSRIYDMDAAPPVYYGEEDDTRRAGFLEPEVFVDGI